jgi:hypothetical protein
MVEVFVVWLDWVSEPLESFRVVHCPSWVFCDDLRKEGCVIVMQTKSRMVEDGGVWVMINGIVIMIKWVLTMFFHLLPFPYRL